MLYLPVRIPRATFQLELVELFDNAIFCRRRYVHNHRLELVELFDNAIFSRCLHCSIIVLELVELFDNAILRLHNCVQLV